MKSPDRNQSGIFRLRLPLIAMLKISSRQDQERIDIKKLSAMKHNHMIHAGKDGLEPSIRVIHSLNNLLPNLPQILVGIKGAEN